MKEMSPAQIVDAIGRLRAQIAPLALREDNLRKLLIQKARHQPKEWDGREYRAALSISDAWCYDAKKLDKFLEKIEVDPRRMKSKVHRETLNVRALKKAKRRTSR